jgi:hypothetical protein
MVNVSCLKGLFKTKKVFQFFVERPFAKFMYLWLKVFQYTKTTHTAAKLV